MNNPPPEEGIVKKAYGMVKAGGHSFKRATLGDIYTLIDEKAGEAKQHREENFRYLNTKIDSQIGEVRQEIGQVRQEIGAVNQRIDTLGTQLNQKIDSQIGAVRQEMSQMRQELSQRLDTVIQILMQQKSQ